MTQSVEQGTCPVCGMQLTPGTGVNVEYQGQNVECCSEDCASKFQEDPSQYVTQ